MLLKQTFKNHFIVLRFTLTTTLLLFIIWWYFDFAFDFLIVGGSLHLLLNIPSLYLHFEYAIRNAGEEIIINPWEIIVRKNGKECKYSSGDLEEIFLYKSASLDRWGIPFTAMEYYQFARIITKSGEQIIITCLLTSNVEEVVKKIGKVDHRIKRAFCTLRWTW